MNQASTPECRANLYTLNFEYFFMGSNVFDTRDTGLSPVIDYGKSHF